VGEVNRHFPRDMIMIIVISQSKLLQRAGLWIWQWHTSYGSATPTFDKYFKWRFVVWSDSSAVVSFHCCITIAVVRLLNTIRKCSVCNNAC